MLLDEIDRMVREMKLRNRQEAQMIIALERKERKRNAGGSHEFRL